MVEEKKNADCTEKKLTKLYDQGNLSVFQKIQFRILIQLKKINIGTGTIICA